jgi:hypothetical protein
MILWIFLKIIILFKIVQLVWVHQINFINQNKGLLVLIQIRNIKIKNELLIKKFFKLKKNQF